MSNMIPAVMVPNKFKSFLKTSILGGLVVILPTIVLYIVFKWIYGLLTSQFSPISLFLVNNTAIPPFIADVLIGIIFIGLCFAIGVFVKTRLGSMVFNRTETSLLKHAPGYNLVKETILLFLGRKKAPFSSVVLVRLFDSDTLMTGLVTDEHADGTVTVFIPTAPNPTSGNIYHVTPKNVYPVDISVEEGIRTIIGCGAGSTKMIEQARKQQ